MTVKEIKELLANYNDDQEVILYGCYGSTGDLTGKVEIVHEYAGKMSDKGEYIKTDVLYLETELCSG